MLLISVMQKSAPLRTPGKSRLRHRIVALNRVAGLWPERAAGSSRTAADVPGLAEVRDDDLAELEGVGDVW